MRTAKTNNWLEIIVEALEVTQAKTATYVELEKTCEFGHSPDPLHFHRTYPHYTFGPRTNLALAADEKPRVNLNHMDLEDVECYLDSLCMEYENHDPALSLEEFQTTVINALSEA